MAFCKKCGAQIEDGSAVCPVCGAPQNEAQAAPAPAVDQYDHTADFAPEEVAEHKTFVLYAYLFSALGIIISLLAVNDGSKYTNFHIRQILKLDLAMIIAILCYIVPIIGWLVGAVAMIALFVIKVIGFIWCCQNKSKELPLIRTLKFLG